MLLANRVVLLQTRSSSVSSLLIACWGARSGTSLGCDSGICLPSELIAQLCGLLNYHNDSQSRAAPRQRAPLPNGRIFGKDVCAARQTQAPSVGRPEVRVRSHRHPWTRKTRRSALAMCATWELRAEVASLVAAGGTFLDLRQDPNSYGNPCTFAVMQNPEGNEFCVLNAESVTGMA